MSFDMESSYIAKKYEDEIYRKWEKSSAFKAVIDRKKKSFTVAMPPPNATGVLHLGHAVMLAIEDIMIRHARMQGRSALWIPGTDHAAIATQSVVERNLEEKGIKNPRETLGREKLLKEIRGFAENSKDVIRNQIRKMGASCDWSREKYTLDDDLNLAVNTLFERMFKDGLIYRGGRIVNWDPKMQTTVADDEVEYVEEKAKFYYFQYGPVVIGTARPETKLLDKVIVVNPKDKRYKHMVGKEFEFEWIEGKIKTKVIADPCVDMSLGTGAMTITPAHSLVDFELAQKYKLDSPQIIDFDGKIRKEVSKNFGGMTIEEARGKIVETLRNKGLVKKIDENYVHNLAVSYRGKGIIEPQVMKQWFVDVNKKVISWKGKKLSIKEVLQDTVKSGMIKIVPKKFEKIYFHWIDNLRDWCISRQIWWGHQIPVWYKVNKKQYDEFNKRGGSTSTLLNILNVDGEVRYGTSSPKGQYWLRDPDTLDTWFSAALWTFSTLGWPKKTEDLKYFHPTAILETGYDILFFWVARMILATTYALRSDKVPEAKCIPFKTVYLHGLIRDRHGKKMSKSNPETCIDPLDMIDKYSADALRLSLVIGSTPGNDMRLYEEKIAGYRNFINKIWNASRFALINVESKDFKEEFSAAKIKNTADKWILTGLGRLIKSVEKDFENHRYSDAGMKIYDFLWSQYCDWYLEISKGADKNPDVLIYVLQNLLKLLHPFVPFVTEKIWEFFGKENLLIGQSFPQENKKFNFAKEYKNFELIKEIILQLRSAKSEARVEPGKKIDVIIYAGKHLKNITKNANVISRLARLSSLKVDKHGEKITQAKSIFVGDIEIYIPLKNLLNPDKEKKSLNEEINSKRKFIHSLEQKLKNQSFLKNAPKEVVNQQKERLKLELTNLKRLSNRLKYLV
ncbi:valine--tRNA ligase [Candidatus Peregrinibacteria bacterium]|nr:valine--tRNA ligase [Candidatus Peregrinibacteria bacterium]